MIGKNFSCNNLGQRKASDLYDTPYSMTRQLFECEKFAPGATILEPACGNKAMVREMARCHNGRIIAYDIETDFLKESRKFRYVITNPPYASLAMEFMLKAKQVATEKFALLLPLAYLHGQKRYEQVYRDREFPLARVHVFTRYPDLRCPIREDGKYSTGMLVLAWFVWGKRCRSTGPRISWIDNNKYVISPEKHTEIRQEPEEELCVKC